MQLEVIMHVHSGILDIVIEIAQTFRYMHGLQSGRHFCDANIQSLPVPEYGLVIASLAETFISLKKLKHTEMHANKQANITAKSKLSIGKLIRMAIKLL